MTVWNQQDWTWRLTAIVGLALSIVPPLSGYCWLTLTPWGSPVSGPSDLLSWTASNTRFVVEWCLGVLFLWLLMLVRRKWGWLWATSWALLGAGLVTLLSSPAVWAASTECPATALAAALGTLVLVSSQIWLGVVGASTYDRPSGTPSEFSKYGDVVWHCAGLAWRLLMVIGGLAALAGVVVVAVHWPWPLWQLPLAAWVPLVAIGLGLVLMPTMLVLLWWTLATSGRTWLWWALTWTLCLPILVAALPEGLKQCRSHEQIVVVLLLPLLAIFGLWVALKARQLQSGQVGLVTH